MAGRAEDYRRRLRLARSEDLAGAVETGSCDLLSLEHIEQAQRVIEPAFLHTPQFTDAELARRVGAEIVVKVETLNPIRSFKGRGADYLMHDLAPGRRIFCASAGNFGQAMAYAGRARGTLVSVYAATNANPAKVARIRQLADLTQDSRT